MPIAVDHDQRRRDVVDIATRLIIDKGLENVSVRAIARQAGYSTAVVSHYFHDKAELMLMCYQTALSRAGERVEEAIGKHLPVQETLERLLPLDDAGRDNWKIWFAFWGMAMADERFQQEQILRGREAQALITRALDECANAPTAPAAGREMQASRLLAMLAGLATQATYDPEGWPAERQRAVLAAELASLMS